MRVINIHRRQILQPKRNVSELFKTLATHEDQIWPHEHWPAMRFKNGLKIGSKGGHGRVRYTIVELEEGNRMTFKFTKPNGFHGYHELYMNTVTENSTEIVHRIEMKTTFRAGLLWAFIIRWLHDALIEDAFDKVENCFSVKQKETEYNNWVKLLRTYYKRKSF